MQAKGMMRGLLVGLCLLAATATAQLSFLGEMNPENGDFGGVPFPLRSEMETFLETDFSGNLVAYGYYMPTLSRFGFLDPVATDPPSGAALEFDTSSLAHPEQLPYKFIGINFNPGGHPGAEYLIPHFDVHFYTKPSEFIRGIVCSNSSFPPCFTTDYIAARFAKTADSTLYPAGYENSPAEWVPAMGAHLVPNPIPATFHTVPAYIFGSYNGELIFHEPMISSQVFLASETTKQVFGWPTTQAYPGPGRFFSRISIEKVTTPTERYKVTLDGLVTAPESHNDVPIFMGSYIQGTAMVATNTLSPTKDCLINNGIDIDGGFTVDSAEGQFCCRIRGEHTGSACVRDTCVGAQPISATFFSSGDKCYAKCAARV